MPFQIKENPTIVNMFIYKHEELCTFIHQCPSNYPLYTYGENSYNGIQGTGQAFDKTIRLEIGVSCCHSHGPLSGAVTACLDRIVEIPPTMAAA